jgi:hypothetical protein
MRAFAAILAISLTALGLAGCDAGTPTAPPGAKVFLSASPMQIGANGTSTITATVLRSSGQPVNPGTEVRLDTTAGTLEEIPSSPVQAATPATTKAGATLIVNTDVSGVATARLRGGGSVVTAKVTARSGGADLATVDVKVGSKVARLTVQANPSSVDPLVTSKVTLLIIVFDELGEPAEGANVVVTTEAGRLDSGGHVVPTNQRGEVVDTLTINVNAAASQADGAVTVSILAQGGGGSATGTVAILLRD